MTEGRPRPGRRRLSRARPTGPSNRALEGARRLVESRPTTMRSTAWSSARGGADDNGALECGGLRRQAEQAISESTAAAGTDDDHVDSAEKSRGRRPDLRFGRVDMRGTASPRATCLASLTTCSALLRRRKTYTANQGGG